MRTVMPLRVIIGYVLLGACALAWVAVFVVPFMGMNVGQSAAVITILIIVGEGAFVLGVLLLGKDVLQKLKHLIHWLKQRLKD